MFDMFKKKEKGVGGLTLLIEGVAMIFVVGLLVMETFELLFDAIPEVKNIIDKKNKPIIRKFTI